MEIKRVAIGEIKPYENNPRLNDGAVDAVAESIRQCGYCAPIVVDENMVILAGHTRHKALQKLGGMTNARYASSRGLRRSRRRNTGFSITRRTSWRSGILRCWKASLMGWILMGLILGLIFRGILRKRKL